MLTSQGVVLLMAAVAVVTLWAFIAGVFMGMNVTYGGICWHGIALLIYAAYFIGLGSAAVTFGFTLPWSANPSAWSGIAFYLILSCGGGWVGQQLVPWLSVDVFGRGPVWRRNLKPDDYALFC